MKQALQELKDGKPTEPLLLTFDELQDVVGFTEYYQESERYKL
jgi:hypothetical protein